jgi:tripartite-type tricarboxylate transporter receptor subunit TctC
MKKFLTGIIAGLVFSLVFVLGGWAWAAQAPPFPIKGKTISWIVGFAAGISPDIGVRLLAPLIEKELGASIEVINRAGANSQIAYTDLAKAKPDGHTIGLIVLPGISTIYLDPNRKAVFTRKSFIPLANHVLDPSVWVVLSSSPYKTVKDVVDAALAKPGTITVSDGGILGDDHLSILHLQNLTGAKFAIAHMTEGRTAALLGGHTVVYVGKTASIISQIKSGEVRVIGVTSKGEHPFVPGVKTMIEQGYNYTSYAARGYALPAGTPSEIVGIWASAMKKVMANPEHLSTMQKQGLPVSFMDPLEYAAFWDGSEPSIKKLMELAK